MNQWQIRKGRANDVRSGREWVPVTKFAEDSRIIGAVLAGEVNAYARIVGKYQKAIYNLMFRTTHSAEISMDLTQETFVRAYQQLERFKLGRSFFSWLYAIGANLAKDHLRRESREQRCFGEAPDFDRLADSRSLDPAECLQQQHSMVRLAEALDQLPFEYREAVILRYQKELPLKEVARALSLTVSGAKMRVQRALQKLQVLLQEDADEHKN